MSCGTKKIDIQFHKNIKFQMTESHILIGLVTSFKNLTESSVCQHLFYIKCIHLLLPPRPLAYGLHACENVDNYGWPFTMFIISIHFLY